MHILFCMWLAHWDDLCLLTLLHALKVEQTGAFPLGLQKSASMFKARKAGVCPWA